METMSFYGIFIPSSNDNERGNMTSCSQMKTICFVQNSILTNIRKRHRKSFKFQRIYRMFFCDSFAYDHFRTLILE